MANYTSGINTYSNMYINTSLNLYTSGTISGNLINFDLNANNKQLIENISRNTVSKDYCSLARGWTCRIDELPTWMMVHNDLITYQFFGSEDSTDVDVMYFVEEMPCVEDCKRIASILKFHLGLKYCDVNLCKVYVGFVVACYKGTIDEVNNMLYDTYVLHSQKYPNQIKRKVPRLVNEKAERAIRGILSHLSRTKYRPEIKKALGKLDRSLEVLKTIDISKVEDLNKNNSNLIEFYKFFATQAGQLIGLYEGVELYTKSDISMKYKLFRKLLYREPFDVTNIDLIKGQLIKWIQGADESKEIYFPSEYYSGISIVNSTTTITGATVNSSMYINYPSYVSLSKGYSLDNDREAVIKADVELIKTLNKHNKERK